MKKSINEILITKELTINAFWEALFNSIGYIANRRSCWKDQSATMILNPSKSELFESGINVNLLVVDGKTWFNGDVTADILVMLPKAELHCTSLTVNTRAVLCADVAIDSEAPVTLPQSIVPNTLTTYNQLDIAPDSVFMNDDEYFTDFELEDIREVLNTFWIFASGGKPIASVRQSSPAPAGGNLTPTQLDVLDHTDTKDLQDNISMILGITKAELKDTHWGRGALICGMRVAAKLSAKWYNKLK